MRSVTKIKPRVNPPGTAVVGVGMETIEGVLFSQAEIQPVFYTRPLLSRLILLLPLVEAHRGIPINL